MIEIKEGETGLHTITNPGQIVFMIVVVLLVVGLTAYGIGRAISKI